MEKRSNGEKVLLGRRENMKNARVNNEVIVKLIIVPSNEPTIVKVPQGTTVEKLLNLMNINPEEVVVLRDKIPITEDDIVHDGDLLEIIRVVSGG